MALARLYSCAALGVAGIRVTVETHLSNGLPGFAIVGLPETVVRESKERVRSAILNSGFEFPSRRITINLAPADIPKSGGRYDLAIALGILQASRQLPSASADSAPPMVLGELNLAGKVCRVPGVLPALVKARANNQPIFVPAANAPELALLDYAAARQVESLAQAVALLQAEANGDDLALTPSGATVPTDLTSNLAPHRDGPGPADIKGQWRARRAIGIAAAGAHNLLMVGPPGSGKTLLANCLVNLLPALSRAEALEVATIHSIANLPVQQASDYFIPPFRAPHHSASTAALVGGGHKLSPGEITLAHQGILFLDELTKFNSQALEALREPLEAGAITISRANYRETLPAQFQLVAAMNPCPCGHWGDVRQECQCGTMAIQRYLGKLSGPLLDRFDLIIEVPALTAQELLLPEAVPVDETALRTEIQRTRKLQLDGRGTLNSRLSAREFSKHCKLGKQLQQHLAQVLDKLGMSARASHRIIRVARTIADLDSSDVVSKTHLEEAVLLRRFQLKRIK